MALSRPELLVLRALGLGDFLTGLPALRATRRAFPDHDLVLAAPRALAPLLHQSGLPARLHDTDGLAPLDRPRPDVAVNLHGRGPESHRLLQALAPARLVAFGCAEAGHDGPAWHADEHEVHRWCRLVTESLGVPADPRELHLRAPAQEAPAPGAVVVHPGAAFPARRWPPERFAGVARWAAGQGYDVVVTGGPGEASLADAVRRTAGLPDRAVLAGRTDLAGLAAQVASAPLVVCGDTGVGHLATAYARPSVVLFGPTPPSRWGPPEHGPHVALWHGEEVGDPWGDRPDPALCRITVAEVVEAAAGLLGAGPRARADGPAPRPAPAR